MGGTAYRLEGVKRMKTNQTALTKSQWWKSAVIYQIYPRSFADSNADGYGDLPGIISKLDYLQDLGIDAIWLCPVFKSPQDDNGYDVADYLDIDPMFGSMSDMKKLIKEAEKRQIRIILDLVLNHSSDEHAWFVEAKKSRENPYHDYYIWREKPTNHWDSPFSDSAWEWEEAVGEYYLHQFSVKQPDLNWENERMRQDLYGMINRWVELGIGGFRLDVIDLLGKEPDHNIKVNGKHLHTYIREMSAACFGQADLVTVGEAWSANTQNAALYSSPDGSELSMVFQFEHILLDQEEEGEKWDMKPLSLVKLKQVIKRWHTELEGKGWNSQFWENHDLPRIVSRWGNDKEYRAESGKMLAMLLMGLQGTPYIYQGQELGMTNISLKADEYTDIETRVMFEKRGRLGFSPEEMLRSAHARSRDNARTPMQWDDSKHAGFTTGEPWMQVNPNYMQINAKNQMEDPNSVRSFYKALIQIRKKHEVFITGQFELLIPEDETLFAYVRSNEKEEILVLCHFYGGTVVNPLLSKTANMKLILSNYETVTDGVENTSNEKEIQEQGSNILRPYEARMYVKTL